MSITSLTARFRRREPPGNIDLDIGGRLVPVVLVRSVLARRAALRVDNVRGEVRLTLPPRVGITEGRRLVEAHRGWIEEKLSRLPAPRPIKAGCFIPFEGEEWLVDWQKDAPRTPAVDQEGRRLIVGGPVEGVPARVERWLRRQALAVLSEETAVFARQVERRVEGIRIGDPKGRWGSCNSQSHIAYSWRLILAPSWVRRSVVAHEVAHLIHLNHSREFHDLHRQLLGADPGPARQWLAANGPSLYWVGRAG